jgi:transcriptional regulator GlxA family with amidase domain
MKIIKILLFDDIELLDFAGPLEVFSVTDHLKKDLGLHVSTIGLKEKITVSKSKLEIIPNEIEHNGQIDLLVIPGGIGTRSIIKNDVELKQIATFIKHSKVVASVCTGALILAKLGHLNGLNAITHKNGIEELKSIDSSIVIDASKRFIDNNHVLTSAGISAGIDMSLYLVEKYFGFDLRINVQNYMEYDNNQ